MGCLHKLLIVLVAAMMLPGTVYSAHDPVRSWEPIPALGENFKPISTHEDIEVFSAPLVIKIRVIHPVKVEIYTILGKLITAGFLEPGLYEYQMATHGIYIIRCGENTCKVAI